MTDDYSIFVGGKPFMNYVTAVVMQFTTKGAEEVIVRSRGKFISRAVDVAEVVKSRFLKDQVEVGEMVINSEAFQNNEGKTVRVSTLDITLKKTPPKAPAPEAAGTEVAVTVEEPAKQPVEEPEPPVEDKPPEVPANLPAEEPPEEVAEEIVAKETREEAPEKIAAKESSE